MFCGTWHCIDTCVVPHYCRSTLGIILIILLIASLKVRISNCVVTERSDVKEVVTSIKENATMV